MLNKYDPSYYDPSFYYYDPYYQMDYISWYVDSGVTAYVASDIDKLDHPPNFSSYNHVVKTSGGEYDFVEGTGTSTIHANAGEIKLDNVCYVPSMKKNLLSVG